MLSSGEAVSASAGLWDQCGLGDTTALAWRFSGHPVVWELAPDTLEHRPAACQLPRQLFPTAAEGQGQNRLLHRAGFYLCFMLGPLGMLPFGVPVSHPARAPGLSYSCSLVFLTLFPGHPCSDLFCVFILYPAFLDIPWREFLCTPRCIPEMEGLNAASPSVKMIILLPVNVASYSALSSRVIREFSG